MAAERKYEPLMRASSHDRLPPCSTAVGYALASVVVPLMLVAVAGSCGDVTADLITRGPDAASAAGSTASDASVAVECQADDDCPAQRSRCDTTDHRCVNCLDPSDCGDGQTCNLSSHTCVLRCTAGAACSGTTPYCDATTGVCRACRSDSECAAPSPYCAAAGNCVECLTLDDCEDDDEAPLCSPAGRCVECITDGHCEEQEERCSSVLGECGIPCAGPGACPFDDPVCDVAVGYCVECAEDADCGEEGLCRNFDCVERDANEKSGQNG